MNFSEIMNTAFLAEQEKTSHRRFTFDGLKASVGASDVAGCARKAAYQILFGGEQPTLQEFFLMRKGNVSEGVIEGNLNELGIKYERQGEYFGTGIFDFMLIHPDILIDVNDAGNFSIEAQGFINRSKGKGCKYILYELKTTNTIPKEPHDYWVRQTNIQAEYIAEAKGISPEEIDIYVYAIELDYGRYAEFHIDYDVEEVMIAQDDALSFVNVIEDYIHFINKEKDTMDLSINDVNRRVGNLCSICKYAHNCLGTGDIIEFPDDMKRELVEIKDYSKKYKNIESMKQDIKSFMMNVNARKGKAPGYAVTIKGGNEKDVINPNSFSDEEKLFLFKKDSILLSINTKAISKFKDSENDEDKWIFDKKHLTSKKTPISVMITEVSNKE